MKGLDMGDSPVSIYKYDGLKIMLVTKDHTIEEVLEAVGYVLRGQGYCFNGRIEVVDEEE